MNKKILAIGTAGAVGAGLIAGEFVHLYMDVMARPLKHRSVLALFEGGKKDDEPDEFKNFTEEKLKWINEQNTERITITSERGDTLAGFLTLAEEKSDVFVLFAHGHHSTHNGDPANFMRYYIEKGFNFLAVDHIAAGESSGNFIGFDYFEHRDCLDWITYLTARFGDDIKIIIHGVSMGGATVCQMADKVPKQVKLAIADCPYTSALEEYEFVLKKAGIKKSANAILNGFNRLNRIFAGFDFSETDVRNAVAKSKVPMLFVDGSADTLIPIEMTKELYDLCKAEKDIFIVDGAEHAKSIVKDENGYHKKLDEFIAKYL